VSAPDRPIAERDADVLGRWGLAKTIYNLISSTPVEVPVRVGIYGGWGEGKTSVMRLVENLAGKDRVAVCWFPVWSARTSADLWAGLVEAMQSVSTKPNRILRAKKLLSKTIATTGEVAAINQYTKAAHALSRLLGSAITVGPKDAARVIHSLEGGGRVIVMIDDLDRADAALVPQLLMGLHDLFDQVGKCAFVIALDPAVVSSGLGQINPAWSSAPAFLEKIVQYPFWLRDANPEQIRRLATESLRNSGLALPIQAVLDVLDLLPTNPRKVKQFFRTLERLRPTIARHGSDELNPVLLLILELVRNACPEAADLLLHDKEFISELAAGSFFTKTTDRDAQGTITKSLRDKIDLTIQQVLPRALSQEREQIISRLVELTMAGAERVTLVTSEIIMQHVALEQEPPVMTMKEFDLTFEAWKKDRSAAHLKALVTQHGKTDGYTEFDVLEACGRSLLRRRSDLLSEAREALEAEEAKGLLARADELSEMLRQLIFDRNLLGDPRIQGRVELFILIRNQHSQCANTLDDEMFAEMRNRERELLYQAAHHLRDRSADVLGNLKPWDRGPVNSNMVGAAEIAEVNDHLRDLFADFLTDTALERFSRPGGMAALGNFTRNPAETWLMFTPGTPFHGPRGRSQFRSIAQSGDQATAQNFFIYLTMLVGGGELPRSALVADPDLVVPAWHATLKLMPQPRARQSLFDLAKALQAALNDEGLIPMPRWAEK